KTKADDGGYNLPAERPSRCCGGLDIAGGRGHFASDLHRSASSGVYGRDDLQADEQGRFRIGGVGPRQPVGGGFPVKGRVLDAGAKLRDLTITAAESKDLGDIKSKPFGK